MKRLFFAILCATIMISIASAQSRLGDFTQPGVASQEMSTEGLVGHHPSLPINSKAKLTNPDNGREVEITIVGRIPPSLNRILDISPSAAQALGLNGSGNVVLTVAAPSRPAPQAPR